MEARDLIQWPAIDPKLASHDETESAEPIIGNECSMALPVLGPVPFPLARNMGFLSTNIDHSFAPSLPSYFLKRMEPFAPRPKQSITITTSTIPPYSSPLDKGIVLVCLTPALLSDSDILLRPTPLSVPT